VRFSTEMLLKGFWAWQCRFFFAPDTSTDIVGR